MFDIVGKSLGRYHVVEQFGGGGMATVFKAYDSSLERFVAVKVIRTEIVMDQEFLKRFQREARALAQLDHPYILKVLDYGEQDGMPYLVMPFEPGGTLKDRMGSPWPYQEAARLLTPIARALECAHQQMIIHRDVKPANILFTQGGTPTLSDFGIAKMLDMGESMQLTGTGMGIGTPDYMAPEQWLGKVDARTDIYALGVVFYEMVTGRRPFTADTPAAVMLKHMQDPLPRPRSIVASLPDEVEQVIFKALAKKPEDRYQEMSAFATALEKLSLAPTIEARPGIPMQVEPTLRAPVVSRPVTGPRLVTGPTPAPAPPVSSIKNWTMGGIAFAVLAGIVVCLAIGAVLFAARSPLLFPGKSTALAQTTPAANLQVTSSRSTPGVKQTGAPPIMATIAARMTETLPPFQAIQGLPEDIPILKENKGDLVLSENTAFHMYLYSTWLEQAKVTDFFRQTMKDQGWTLSQTSTVVGKSTTSYVYTKSDRMVMISLFTQNNNPDTWIQYAVQKDMSQIMTTAQAVPAP